ncbi:hypothetical protein [Mucilaginibacter sp.]
MKLQTIKQPVAAGNKLSVTRELYNRYSGMLLGYLTDIVKEQQMAEAFLIEIFNELPQYVEQLLTSEKSTWLQLQAIAKSKLAPFMATQHNCRQLEDDMHRKWTTGGSNMAYLTPAQRSVFCGVYYHQKSITTLAAELNQPEDVIKSTLKAAFNTIKNGR